MARKLSRAASSRVVLATAAFVLVPSTVLAYLLPAEVIFSNVAKRRSDIAFSTITVEGTYQRGDAPPVPVWEVIKDGKAHRVERKGPGATEIVLTVPGRRWSYKLGEKPGAAQKIPSDLVLYFLGSTDKDAGGQRGVAFARQRGIDENEVSLGRFEERPVYIIGAKPWETNKPQLWIDKVLSAPVRLIEVDRAGSITDTRLYGIGTELTNEWFPRRIEVWRDGKLVESSTYTKAELNAEVSDDLFKTPS
ncbi:hypothetical protein L6R52_29500 [Myxococcota bacterium]|nr:hypothetical protein [Myxococcota bacterium]